MLPTIENSEKFKTEFRNFKEKISTIQNESLQMCHQGCTSSDSNLLASFSSSDKSSEDFT